MGLPDTVAGSTKVLNLCGWFSTPLSKAGDYHAYPRTRLEAGVEVEGENGFATEGSGSNIRLARATRVQRKFVTYATCGLGK